MPKDTGFTTIRVTDALRKKLRIRAAEEGVPMYKILDEWLTDAATTCPSSDEKDAADVND